MNEPNSRSAIWKSNGKHLEEAINNGVACTGTTGRVYPRNSTLIVADQNPSGDYAVALGKCTGEIVEEHPNVFWESWVVNEPENVVINNVLFFAKCEKEAIKIGMLKKRSILGDKWFSPESEQEKQMFVEIIKKEKQKENKEN